MLSIVRCGDDVDDDDALVDLDVVGDDEDDDEDADDLSI